MNWLDVIIAVIIAISFILGYRKGFLRKVLGICGIIAGFILAVRFYKPISGFIQSFVKSNSNWIPVICFLVIIGIIFFISVWLARFIAGINSGTKTIDKIAGALFGCFQGLILASILVVNLSFLNYPDLQTRTSSNLYPVVYNIAPYIFDKVLELSPQLKNMYEEYKKVFKV